MADNVHYLTPKQTDIGHYIRLGHTGFRILENLYVAGRLPIKRAVIDASHIAAQADLLSCLRDSGVELILDLKSAELSTPGGHATSANKLPWAHSDRFHRPTDFSRRYIIEYSEKIAEYAVSHQVDVIHSATHEITGPDDPWLSVDADICFALRQALDRCGGQRIQIDYPLILPYGVFHKEDKCAQIIKRLETLPFINLWLRVSNFGMASASSAGVIKYIHSAWKFRSLEKPIIADGVAGLIGMSLAAFGAVGGICHGIAEKTDFNNYHWKKLPSDKNGGARPRIYLPGIDLFLYQKEAELLLQGRGAKSLLACNDYSCCAHDHKNMFDQHKAHAIRQSIQLLSAFNQTPESLWVNDLIKNHIEPVGRTLRKVERIKLNDTGLREKMKKHSHRIDLIYQAVQRLSEEVESIPYSLKPALRHIEFPSYGRIG